MQDEIERNRRESKERDNEDRRRELDFARRETQALMDSAKRCWEVEKGRKCSVSLSQVNETGGPRDFCRVCPKFVKDVKR